MANDENERTDPLSRVQAYQLAMAATRLARLDAHALSQAAHTRNLAGQLLTATTSIAANIAEGYSRGTPADRRKFFEYALGSVRESLVWYEAAELDDLQDREGRLVSIRRLLLTMIRNSRASTAADLRKYSG